MFANRICKSKTLELGGKEKLRREEAISFLKEVLSADPNISPEAVTLSQLGKPNNYRLKIKENLSSQTVKEVAQKHHLSVKEEKDVMIVYTPTA